MTSKGDDGGEVAFPEVATSAKPWVGMEVSICRFENVATPLTALTVTVPSSERAARVLCQGDGHRVGTGRIGLTRRVEHLNLHRRHRAPEADDDGTERNDRPPPPARAAVRLLEIELSETIAAQPQTGALNAADCHPHGDA